jgi:hypothetical protein
MSQGFKTRFDKMLENDPSPKDAAHDEKNENYPAAGNGRNICFILSDEQRVFLNYSYMVSCEYKPEENLIAVEFTTCMVVLKGYKLVTLFNDLMNQLPRLIIAVNARYNQLAEGKAVVNDIIIEKK